MTETATVTDAWSNYIVMMANVIETATMADSFLGALLCNPIPDNQTPNWSQINDSQTVTWSNISDNQTPNWQNVNDAQSVTWSQVDTAQTRTWTQTNN